MSEREAEASYKGGRYCMIGKDIVSVITTNVFHTLYVISHDDNYSIPDGTHEMYMVSNPMTCHLPVSVFSVRLVPVVVPPLANPASTFAPATGRASEF